MRTTENDNDVAKKYFRDPSTIIQQQKVAVLQKSDQDNDDGNALIQKLRQQSVDNREKNDLYVARKTFEADQVCIFNSRQVMVFVSHKLTTYYNFVLFVVNAFNF